MLSQQICTNDGKYKYYIYVEVGKTSTTKKRVVVVHSSDYSITANSDKSYH